MRYCELVEDDAKLRKIKKGLRLIKLDCQPYLSQVKDPAALRRGVSRDYDADPINGRPIINKKQAHLTGRYPRGRQMKEWHTLVNDYLTSEFGLPYRNGIMSTGDQLQAGGFGVDVAIFPIGKFSFLWSPNVKDLNRDVRRWSGINGARGRDVFIGHLKDAGYQDTDLQAAIDSKNEIMIWVEEYYTVDNSQVDRLLMRKLLK